MRRDPLPGAAPAAWRHGHDDGEHRGGESDGTAARTAAGAGGRWGGAPSCPRRPRAAGPLRPSREGHFAVNGIGPVEPGAGTRGRPPHASGAAAPAARSLARLYAAHRRAAHALLAAVLLLAGGCLYASLPPAARPAKAELPFPARTVDVGYLGEIAVPPGARPRTFAFEVLLGVRSGPPVTVTTLTPPGAGLTLTSAPRAPFRTKKGAARKIVITLHVTECRKPPRNTGLAFVGVTLRNARAIQVRRFPLGPRYAHDLSAALQVACSNDFR